MLLLCSAIYWAYASENFGGGKNMEKETYTTLSNGVTATFKEYDRELTLTDFCQVNIESAYEDAVKLLGEPNGKAGSGVAWPYYKLSDGTCVILHCFGYEDNKAAKIFDIRILDRSGRIFELKKNDK
jgi:hypothetical protein